MGLGGLLAEVCGGLFGHAGGVIKIEKGYT